MYNIICILPILLYIHFSVKVQRVKFIKVFLYVYLIKS